MVNEGVSNRKVDHNAIIESRMTQMHQENKRRRPEGAIYKGDKVYLSTENLSLPKNRTRKLMPKYIGPYKVVDAHPAESRYTLDLPPELKACRIHPTFHVNWYLLRLRRCQRRQMVGGRYHRPQMGRKYYFLPCSVEP